jgi:hypothetical protein
MSNSEFEEQIAAIMRRLTTLRAVQRGDLSVRRIAVKAHHVPAYNVGRHYRNIVVRPKQKVATARKKAA